MANTPNLNLPKITDNMSADVVRDMNALADAVDGAAAKASDLAAHKADYLYQKAGGTAKAIMLTGLVLEEGHPKTFIASANNSGEATTINGKALYKPNTTTAPSLIFGKAYTVWYSKTDDCFFIKASAEGSVTVDKVLAGETFSNDSDTGLVGTMSNNGAITITPGTADKGISAGYHNGSGKVKGDINLIAANILEGKSIFGVNGNVKPRLFATGSMSHSSNSQLMIKGYRRDSNFTYDENTNQYIATVTTLNFLPKLVIFYLVGDFHRITVYDGGALYLSGKVTSNSSSEYFYYLNENPSLYVNSTGFKLAYYSATTPRTVYWAAIG